VDLNGHGLQIRASEENEPPNPPRGAWNREQVKVPLGGFRGKVTEE